MKHLALLMAVFAITGCQSKKENKEGADGKPTITVTLEPQRYFAEAIAGDKFNVVSMVPKGVSPETYDPTPQQLVTLGNSKAYLRIGYIGFELVWMDRLIANTAHLQVFDTSADVTLIHAGGLQHGDHYHTGGVEPHIWNSAVNARIIARNTFKALCRLDKQNETYYLARYDSLTCVINHTDSLIQTKFKTPGASGTFMIYHPALSYFAHDYGLTQISIEENGKEPSPAHMKKLIDTARRERVKVIFIQPEFDKRNAEIVAKETGAHIVPIDPLNYNWPDEMLKTADSLVPATASTRV